MMQSYLVTKSSREDNTLMDTLGSHQNCLARALYDNISQSPDELPFRKGDILTVLEQNTNGLEGWWLCSLRGRQGICPSNRLRLMAGMNEPPATTVSKRRPGNINLNKVITPHKVGDIYLYDNLKGDEYDVPPTYRMPKSRTLPVSASATSLHSFDSPQNPSYDIPKSPTPIAPTYNTPRPQTFTKEFSRSSSYSSQPTTPHHLQEVTQAFTYDIPPSQLPSNRSSGIFMQSTESSITSPTNSICSITPSLSMSSLRGTSSNRSSLEPQCELYNIPSSQIRKVNEGLYDVPPQVTKDTEQEDPQLRLSSASVESKESAPILIRGKELPLELSAAMDTLIRLQQQVQSCISKLFSFVSSSWRQKESLQTNVYDIKLCCNKMRLAVQEFVDFSEGTLANSTHAEDKLLCVKLTKLVQPIREANNTVQKVCKVLNVQGWSANHLAIEGEINENDELEQLVACARELTEDIRQVASFIQGNSTLLFKRSGISSKKSGVQERPLPLPPKNSKEENPYENDSVEWIDDYDYVNMEPQDVQSKTISQPPAGLCKSFGNVSKDTGSFVVDNFVHKLDLSSSLDKLVASIGKLDVNDHEVLKFYSGQLENHSKFLTYAIDAFLAAIENNQQPKVFVEKSKFVVLSAHILVYIGDTIHRNVVNGTIRNKVMLCCNALGDALSTMVKCTKVAAIQFPSVIAVQEMVDSIVDISHCANDLKSIILSLEKF